MLVRYLHLGEMTEQSKRDLQVDLPEESEILDLNSVEDRYHRRVIKFSVYHLPNLLSISAFFDRILSSCLRTLDALDGAMASN